jgi:Fe-S-cluster containining protein
MPAKGQSCQTCNGHCCHSIIGYMHPDPEHNKLLMDRNSSVQPDLSKHCYQDFSHKELLGFGMVEISLPETKDHCTNLTKDGRCKLHGPNKPRLCASYWCHGRLWQARGLQTAKNLV